MDAKRLPSKSVNQGAHNAAMRGQELYPTPVELTLALLRAESIPHTVWEPAAGLGHMSDALISAGHTVHASDILDYGRGHQVVDFLQTNALPPGVETIVTNPPFSLSAQFVRHGLRLCKTVYILNRLSFLEGANRRDIIDGPLARVLPFVERPPMMHRHTLDPVTGVWLEWPGRKASSAMPVAWFVFRRDHNARVHGTGLRRISWRAGGQKNRV